MEYTMKWSGELHFQHTIFFDVVASTGTCLCMTIHETLLEMLLSTAVASKLNEIQGEAVSLPYGTAGFRTLASRLNHATFKCGLLAALRSYANGKEACGVCITASHNAPCDNGIKLVDSSGGMLSVDFECHATSFIQVTSNEAAGDKFVEIAADVAGKDVFSSGTRLSEAQKHFSGSKIILGRDTRITSPKLARLIADAVNLLEGELIDLGEVTTPMLQFAVLAFNRKVYERFHFPATAEGLNRTYFSYFEKAVRDFCKGAKLLPSKTAVTFLCDAANGVGALHMPSFASVLRQCFNLNLAVRNIETENKELLNTGAGAEHIQKTLSLPTNFFMGAKLDEPYTRCCALDGDADRLIYFTADEARSLRLIDGDKIGALYWKMIVRLLQDTVTAATGASNLRVGVVQTAYANGASTAFFEKECAIVQKLPGIAVAEVACVKTGVKHLHHKALEYDIAVYFESNGHGTVLYNEERIEEYCKVHMKDASMLKSFLQIFNQATGDAMTGILAAEAALHCLNLDTKAWINLYKDLPVVQRKVLMPRNTLDSLKPHSIHEKWLIEPCSLQDKINEAVRGFQGSSARAFVRPSGTEDVCRIYVEANSNVVELADNIESILRNFVA